MQKLRNVCIAATGMEVPDRVVTNRDLEELMTTSDEWIRQRTGIEERRYVDENTAPSDLAERACRKALKERDLTPEDVDLLIVATLSSEHYFPGTAAFVQSKLGMGTKPSMGIRCQCSGFLYALNVGKLFVASGQYERVMVVGVEVHSRGLDMTDRGRDVAVLFGDGAGAMLLEPTQDPERGIMSVHLHSEGEHAEKLWVEAPRLAKSPYVSAEMIEAGMLSPKMDGRFVFKNAVVRLPQVIHEALDEHHLKIDDIDHFFFHQANLRINEFVAAQMKIPAEKIHNNIQRYGNCSAASIPMLVDEAYRSGQVKPGQLTCLAAFGSGFTWASAIVRW